jgi:hypothetical protein
VVAFGIEQYPSTVVKEIAIVTGSGPTGD